MDCEARRPRWCVAPLHSVRFLATRFPATAFFFVAALVGFGAKCCADQHEDCTATKCYPWLTCESYTDAESQPTKTCEIECTDNTDCPCGQTCVDITPGPGFVCMECTGEGIATDDPATCCAGLAAMSACLPGDIDCDGGYLCTACGDGVCGEHESPWECPADCADCAALGLDAAGCAKSTVEYWVAEKRRQTAAELAAMPFADRAEAIADRAWYGRVPGTAYTEMHEDGAVNVVMGLKLTPEMLGLADVAVGGSAADLAEAFVLRHGATLLGLTPDHGEFSVSTRDDWGSNREIVIFRQSFDSVPVVGGELYLSFAEDLTLVEIDNTLVPGITHGTSPDVSIEDSLMAIARQVGVAPVVAVRSGLFIYPGQVVRTESQLTYEIAVADPQTGTEFGAFRVDAITGEVLEKHGYDWRWPHEMPLPDPPPDQHFVRFYLVDDGYENAYNCSGETCDLGNNYSAGDGSIAMKGQSYTETRVWAGGDDWDGHSDWLEPTSSESHLDAWEITEMKPVAYLFEEILWPFIDDNDMEASGVLGTSEDDVLGIIAKAKMGGETIAYNDSIGNNDLYTVEGAFDIGTVAHEFGHSTGASIQTASLDGPVEEGRADAWGLILKTWYNYPETPDGDQPEIHCYNENGDLMDSSPSQLPVLGSCFNVWNDDDGLSTWDWINGEWVEGGYRHQNIQVQHIQTETRCSAIEKLEMAADEADSEENIWRSMSNPGAKNHGHGRSPAVFDRFLASDANEFQAGVWRQASNAFWDDEQHYQQDFCGEFTPGDDAACVCFDNTYGVSHMNNGIHNSFFYNLSGLPGAAHSLESNPRAAAGKQLDLLQSIYATSVNSYTGWGNKIATLIDDEDGLGEFDDAQKEDISRALRDTGVFLGAGQATYDTDEGIGPADLEAISVFSDVDDQHLYVFKKRNTGFYDNNYARTVSYSVYALDGMSWEMTEECSLPSVSTDEGAMEPISGFAPTAVKLEDNRIWVAWAQYHVPVDEYSYGTDHGHLAYATLQPGEDGGCGTWSEVVYDADTEVHGSLRSTLVDRGYVWNGFTWIDCPNPPCFDWPFDDWMDYVNPPDYATLGMLANLGFGLDDIQNGAMGGSAPPPPQEDIDGAIAAMRALTTTDGLGVSRQPTSRGGRAPQSADMSVDLNMRDLNVGLEKASVSATEIAEQLSELLPNTVSFLDEQRSSPAPISVKLSLWEPPPPPPEVGGETGVLVEVPLVNVSTVAVSFLDAEEHDDYRRHAIVREYGVTDDPFEPVDHIVGHATYTPGLATVGYTQDEGTGYISITRNNVVACSDFVYSSLNDDEIGRLSCMVFMGADFTPTVEGIRKLKPGMELDGIGIDVDTAVAPRLMTVDDTVYILYRTSGDIVSNPYYIAMRGPEFEPVSYNTLMSGLELPESFDGPKKLLTRVKLNVALHELPDPGGWSTPLWPIFPAAFYSTIYGGMGYVEVYSSPLAGTDRVYFYARGLVE